MHDIPQLMNQNALCVSIKLMFATHEAKANSHLSYEHQAAHRAQNSFALLGTSYLGYFIWVFCV